MSSELISHWPLPQHNSDTTCEAPTFPRQLPWLPVQTDQYPNFSIPLQDTSASLVDYQSIFPFCMNITLIILLNTENHLGPTLLPPDHYHHIQPVSHPNPIPTHCLNSRPSTFPRLYPVLRFLLCEQR